jgi:hypothetical protein
MTRAWLFLAAASSAACFQDFSTDPPVAVRAMEHVSPPSVQVIAGGDAPVPTVRLVEQASREPVAGQTVEFLLRPGAGAIVNVVTRTDANGIASAGKWTLPVQAGDAILDARAGGASVSFVATIKPAAPVALKAMDTTIAWIAGESAPAPVVAVVDRYGNAIEGAALSFSITRGGGELTRSEVISSNGGKATPGWWKLGAAAGQNEITVTSPGTAPLAIRTLGLDPATIAWYDLETAGGSPVPSSALDRGALGFTKFDPCLCAGESGYFLVDAVQAAGLAGSGAQQVGLSGRYQVQAKQLQLIGEGGETRASPEGSTTIYMIRDQVRAPEAGRIRLDVARWFLASGNWFTTTWVFKEVSR